MTLVGGVPLIVGGLPHCLPPLAAWLGAAPSNASNKKIRTRAETRRSTDRCEQ
jgi:hypothetical protein